MSVSKPKKSRRARRDDLAEAERLTAEMRWAVAAWEGAKRTCRSARVRFEEKAKDGTSSIVGASQTVVGRSDRLLRTFAKRLVHWAGSLDLSRLRDEFGAADDWDSPKTLRALAASSPVYRPPTRRGLDLGESRREDIREAFDEIDRLLREVGKGTERRRPADLRDDELASAVEAVRGLARRSTDRAGLVTATDLRSELVAQEERLLGARQREQERVGPRAVAIAVVAHFARVNEKTVSRAVAHTVAPIPVQGT